jgi:oxygen-dependent protoporphyrinogen oxidase
MTVVMSVTRPLPLPCDEAVEARMDDVDVVVVGGGISGLSAARDLHRSGCRVRLLEQSERCGGVIVTDRTDGFVIDAGPDTLLGHKPAALALCRELGLEPSLTPPLAPRTTYVVRRGALRGLPETSAFGFPSDWTSLLTTRAFSWAGKLRMAAEPLMPPAPRDDESIASFVGRRFGREAVTYLAEPLLAGLHKGDAARLSMHALFPTFVHAERTHGSVVRSWRGHQARATGTGSMALTAGMRTLVDALRDALPCDVVRSGARVQVVERAGASRFAAKLADGTSVRSQAVVLAVPPPAVHAITRHLHPGLARLCGEIRCESSVSVALAYRAEVVRRELHGWGVVVPADARLHTSTISYVSSKWPGRVPPGFVLFRASLGGARHPGVVDEPEAALVAQVHGDMQRLLGVTAAPALARVYRWPSAIPQLEVGHLSRLAAIEHLLRATPGLFVTAAGFRGVGLPDCIADARRTAAAVARLLRTDANPEGRIGGNATALP